MELDSIEVGARAELTIRIIYVAAFVVLSVFALVTYRELQQQRSAPVILPHYAFHVVDSPEKASVVQVLGTWYAAEGPTLAGTLQTTTIECNKAHLQCVESTAAVSTNEKGLMDSTPTMFEVERWTDEEIITKPERGRCTTRILNIDLASRQVRSVISAIPDAEACKEQPRTLKLDSGAKARSDALGKAS